MNKYQTPLSILLILVVTFIAFYPSLKNDFVNWDDNVYVTENPVIRHLSWFIPPLSYVNHHTSEELQLYGQNRPIQNKGGYFL